VTAPTMLTTEPGFRLEYVVTAEAYWADTYHAGSPPRAVDVSKAAEGGGCAWQFKIVDFGVMVDGQPHIQVRVFEEAFPAFVELAPFFAALAERKPATLGEVRGLLDGFGVVDATERVKPAG
jgi:hypothetical protein